MHAVIKIILDMQISKCNVISGYGKFWTFSMEKELTHISTLSVLPS
jgi:hypothetical protein